MTCGHSATPSSETFPLSPPLGEGGSWDALSDSLFDGLMDTEGDRIAIVWPRSETWCRGTTPVFTTSARPATTI